MKRRNNGQGEFFEWKNGAAYARRTDPVTSHIAAKFVKGKLANESEQAALKALMDCGHGLTSHGIVAWTGIHWSSISPRMRPLCRKGLVYDTGKTEPGPLSGKPCIVWDLVSRRPPEEGAAVVNGATPPLVGSAEVAL